MTPEEILIELTACVPGLPRTAMIQAMEHQEAITPGLLEILEDFAQDPGLTRREDFTALIPALFLLAQFRERRSLPLVLALLNRPEFMSDGHISELVTGPMPSLLASVGGGDPGPLVAFAQDGTLGWEVRAAALDALLILFFEGGLDASGFAQAYASIFSALELDLEGEERSLDDLRTTRSVLMADAVLSRQEALLPWVARAFEDGWVDRELFSPTEMEDLLAMNAGHVRRRFLRHNHPVEDALLEMESWLRYVGEAQAPRPSRNGPCPCGSGKKFKRCCGVSG